MTSIPPSRRVRAPPFPPRSWPSWPGFPIRTRIFFAMAPASIQKGLLPDPEDLPHHVADLAEGRPRPDRVEDERHRVRVPLARLRERIEGRPVLLRVTVLAEPLEPPHLPLEHLLRHPQRLDLGGLVHNELVPADDNPLLVLDLLRVT